MGCGPWPEVQASPVVAQVWPIWAGVREHPRGTSAPHLCAFLRTSGSCLRSTGTQEVSAYQLLWAPWGPAR